MFSPPWIDAPNRPLVVAFGGNALLPEPDGKTSDAELEERVEAFGHAVLRLLPDHAGLVLVHGNGPQVGMLALRVEATRDTLPGETLDILVAQTQGSIGYLLSRALRNVFARRRRNVEIATVVTQVVVDADDPAFTEPTKPIGPFFPPDEGRRLARERGWDVTEIPNRGIRRVVPSPIPREVVELHTIADATSHGHVVIAGGGGGVPVIRTEHGLVGVEAVIDKDRTAATLARWVRAAGFVILTEVAHVALGFGTDAERRVAEMTVAEARRYLAAGEFPPGSMGPKVEACIEYAEATGRPGLITSVDALAAALGGRDGTWIGPDAG